MNPIRFTEFRVWQVVVPCRADLLAAPASSGYAGNLSWPELPIHLVEGQTTDGSICVGESCRGESREVVEKTLRSLLALNFAAFHPATLQTHEHDATGLPTRFPLHTYEVGAAGLSYMILESLWHDAVGKASGVPAHVLMGGAMRRSVPVDFWANRPDDAPLLTLVREACDLGLSGIKLKSDKHGDTARAVLEIATEIPRGFHVTIDPMCAWRTYRECKHLLQALGKTGLDIRIEDPFAHNADDEWREAARVPGITLVYHARSMESLKVGLNAGVAAFYNCGGIIEHDFQRIAAAADFAGKDCWHGSSIELGVLQALHLHGAACARNCVLPSDLCSEWVRKHTLVTPQMQIQDGCCQLTQSPGLGVSLNHDAMQPYIQDEFVIRA